MTIYDIAEKAGVSITTVSRVLNGKENVNAKTRAHILAVLEECGYTPNRLAQGLASKATKTIGVMAVDIRDIHHSTIAYQVEQTLSTLGYSSILCNFSGNKNRLPDYLDMLFSRQVDGFIFIGSVFAGDFCRGELASRLDGSKPTVFINGTPSLPGAYCVIEQEEDAMKRAVEYLYHQCDRRHIAFVGMGDTASERSKRKGYEAAVDSLGLTAHTAITAQSLAGGESAVSSLLDTHPSLDALVFTDDITACGGVRRLLQIGRSVPGDIAVVGFNNSLYSEICIPSLTSIDNRMYETGKIAAGILADALEGREPEAVVSVGCQLVIRDSTGIRI
ncbi:LacI family transcriptional regulator [Ruminococcaceae bacterium OttesenSCG-928-L11]|nr:LacI family transcriptional regulator [Ruminococcaceae bacterium OttesenSCG-928-L11]